MLLTSAVVLFKMGRYYLVLNRLSYDMIVVDNQLDSRYYLVDEQLSYETDITSLGRALAGSPDTAAIKTFVLSLV